MEFGQAQLGQTVQESNEKVIFTARGNGKIKIVANVGPTDEGSPISGDGQGNDADRFQAIPYQVEAGFGIQD